jgi:WD40 repeat protein
VTETLSGAEIETRGPWKGLAPYDDSSLDAQLFFGRDREVEVACANLTASRLTVLFGASGVGKSSLLRAGVVRRLREQGGGETAAAIVSSWASDPLKAVAAAARTAVEESLGRPLDDAGGSLADRIRAWTEELGGELYLLLDQVEEYFLYHQGDNGAGSFAAEFPALVTERGLRVHVLLGIREDSLGLLDAFRAAVPGVLSNYLRLERLDRDAGRAAILGPIARWNELASDEKMTAEPELVEAVLDEVAAGRIEPDAGGIGGVTPSSLVERIEAPYLQLVLERLWETERAEGSALLRRETLRRLGGAAHIVEEHLERSLSSLDADEREGVATLFTYLVTPSGTKIAHTVDDLASYARLDRSRATSLVSALERERILRPADGGRVEIYHDVLAAAVGAWRRSYEGDRALERERRRHRRLVAVLAGTAAALAVVAAIAVYALAQRADARDQARAAEARALVAEASSAIGIDAPRGLRLALDAARIERSAPVEDVLRLALLYPYVSRPPSRGALSSNLESARAGLLARADGTEAVVTDARGRVVEVVDHGALLTSVDLHPSGRFLVTAGGLRIAKIWDLRRGRVVRELDDHFAPVLDAAFSPDGALVATANVDSGVRLFETATGELKATMIRHGNHVTDVDFSPDGRILGSASLDQTARLWEVPSGRGLGVLQGHRSAVVGVSVESVSSVVTAGRDGTLLTFDARFEPQLRLLARLPAPVDAVQFVGRDTVEASSGGALVSIDYRTGRVSRRGSAPRAPALWEIDEREVRLDSGVVLRGHRRPVTSVAASRDGRFLVTTSRDSDVRIWERETGRLVRVLRGHFGAVWSASFSRDGRWIVTGGPTTAGLWKVGSGRLVFFMRGHTEPVTAVAFDAAGRRVVTGSRDGTIRTHRCEICGGVDELVALAERRLALARPR